MMVCRRYEMVESKHVRVLFYGTGPGRSSCIYSTGTARHRFPPSLLMPRYLVTLLLLLIVLLAGWSGPPDTFTDVQSIRHLSPEEANRSHPVDLTATVTHWDPRWNILFIQDETAGIYVHAYAPDPQDPDTPDTGDRIRIRGHTHAGGFSPVIIPSRIDRLGRGTPPPATEVTTADLQTGSYDSQLIHTEGYLAHAYIEDEHLVGTLLSRVGEIAIRVYGFEHVPSGLVGRHVRIRGVAGAIYTRQARFEGGYVAASGPDELRPTTSGDLASTPDARCVPIGRILTFTPNPDAEPRLRVRGTITFRHRANRYWYVQDSTGGVRVEARRLPDLAVGSRVAVTGFNLEEGRPAAVLRHAEVEVLGASTSADAHPGALAFIDPTLTDRTDLSSFDDRLVELEGRLVNEAATHKDAQWLIQTGSRVVRTQPSGTGFTASYEAPRPGSRLRLRGVFTTNGRTGATSGHAANATLLLRSESDVTVLENSPWWTVRRATFAAGGLGLFLLAGVGWIALLRRNVREKTATIREKMATESKLRAKAQKAAEAREQMMAQVHHEIRSPLTSIVGFADLLRQDARSDQAPHLDRIQANARHMLAMAERMLDYTRLEAGGLAPEPSEVDVTAALREIIESLVPAADRAGLELRADLPEESLPARLDRTFLERIVRNLAENAIAYTDEGTVRVELSAEAGRLLIGVEDTGPGMSEDELDTIFEAFQQGKRGARSRKGTGLGLHLTARLAEKMGGSIDVTSTPGTGTRFEVALPLRRKAGGNGSEETEPSGLNAVRDDSPETPR